MLKKVISLTLAVFIIGCIEKKGRYEQVKVRGQSMYPTLKHLQSIKVDRYYYDTESLEAGDIVVALIGKDKRIVKRVYAREGDSFAIQNVENGCHLMIKEKSILNSKKESHLFASKECQMFSLYEKDYNGKVPAGAVLLLGDNIEQSLDASDFGLIGSESIVGKVVI